MWKSRIDVKNTNVFVFCGVSCGPSAQRKKLPAKWDHFYTRVNYLNGGGDFRLMSAHSSVRFEATHSTHSLLFTFYIYYTSLEVKFDASVSLACVIKLITIWVSEHDERMHTQHKLKRNRKKGLLYSREVFALNL